MKIHFHTRIALMQVWVLQRRSFLCSFMAFPSISKELLPSTGDCENSPRLLLLICPSHRLFMTQDCDGAALTPAKRLFMNIQGCSIDNKQDATSIQSLTPSHPQSGNQTLKFIQYLRLPSSTFSYYLEPTNHNVWLCTFTRCGISSQSAAWFYYLIVDRFSWELNAICHNTVITIKSADSCDS